MATTCTENPTEAPLLTPHLDLLSRKQKINLAAAAIGLRLQWRSGSCKGGTYEGAFRVDDVQGLLPWSPDVNDADNRHLQVALGVSLVFKNDGRDYWVAWHGCAGSGMHYVEEYEGDSAAAARCAVLCLAVGAGQDVML